MADGGLFGRIAWCLLWAFLVPAGDAHPVKDDTYEVDIRMPDVVPEEEDALVCHAVKLDPEVAYILRYEPHASKKNAHHMNLYGCGIPGSDKASWSCGRMDDKSDKSVCGDGPREIVWAWGMDAPGRSFPKDVGFRVGGDTRIQYLIIQLHYARKFQGAETDNSGLTLTMTKIPQPLQAGYYVLYNYGYIPSKAQDYHLESACTFDKNYTIHPIGYRTHSHNLGVVTSGYHIRDNKWTEIGRMSPQLPQMFYNVTNTGIEVKKGDILAARCTMSSDRSFDTRIGPTHKEEMCNFYVMYYTAHPDNIRIQFCYRDAQQFRWADYLTGIPESASSLQGVPAFTRVDEYADLNVPKRDGGLM